MPVKNRLAEALTIRDMKQVDLSAATGIDKSSINCWKNNRWEPKSDALHKMAKALNVSELWLAGYDVPMERPVEQIAMDTLAEDILTIKNDPQLRRIVHNVAKLSGSQLDALETVVEAMLSAMA